MVLDYPLCPNNVSLGISCLVTLKSRQRPSVIGSISFPRYLHSCIFFKGVNYLAWSIPRYINTNDINTYHMQPRQSFGGAATKAWIISRRQSSEGECKTWFTLRRLYTELRGRSYTNVDHMAALDDRVGSNRSTKHMTASSRALT